MNTKNRTVAHRSLIDGTRMDDAAVTVARSADALLGYLSRLDALREAQLHPDALADRAALAELHMRVLLSAGLDALNELNDLGVLDEPPDDDTLQTFNNTAAADTVTHVLQTLRERAPDQRWLGLETARQLVEGVELRVERDDRGLRAEITHSGQTTIVRLDPEARASRVSTKAFFSDGADRIYVSTSAVFAPETDEASPVAGYDALIGGMAFAREWVYRHACNAAELGPPAGTGGGPVVAVIAVVLAVIAAAATVAAAILAIACAAGSDGACRLAAYLGLAASVLGGTAKALDAKSGQQRVLSYGTNPV